MTLGEPAGIGPDLTLALWQRRAELDLPAFYLLGEIDFLNDRARTLGLEVPLAPAAPEEATAVFSHALPVASLGLAVSATPGRPDASSAPAAIASIRRAVADVLEGRAGAVVTNPVAKNVLYRSGFVEPGHTEFLARLAAEASGRAARPVMMLWSPELSVVPVTIHLPLLEVPANLSFELVVETGRIVARDLQAALRDRKAAAGGGGARTRMPARTARSATRILPSSSRPLTPCAPKASTRAGRCRPTPCSMRQRARATTWRCACITTRR